MERLRSVMGGLAGKMPRKGEAAIVTMMLVRLSLMLLYSDDHDVLKIGVLFNYRFIIEIL